MEYCWSTTQWYLSTTTGWLGVVPSRGSSMKHLMSCLNYIVHNSFVNTFMPSGTCYLYHLDTGICSETKKMVISHLIIPLNLYQFSDWMPVHLNKIIKYYIFFLFDCFTWNENPLCSGEDLVQTHCLEGCDLGLHYFQRLCSVDTLM